MITVVILILMILLISDTIATYFLSVIKQARCEKAFSRSRKENQQENNQKRIAGGVLQKLYIRK